MRHSSILPLIMCVAITSSLCDLSPVKALAEPSEVTDTQTKAQNFFEHLVAKFKTPTTNPYTEQDKAAQLARDGQYDQALVVLEPLYKKNTHNLSIARDYVSVLSWAGRDQEAVTIYESLPPQEPDFVLAAIGHSYRKLNQSDKALAVYRLGLASNPDNVSFVEGEIRCLADKEDYDTALARANDDIIKHGDRSEIIAAKQDISFTVLKQTQDKAVSLARSGQYQQALDILSDLHAHHEGDIVITRDYLSILSWAGGHDDMVVALYDSLQSQNEPDYVLEAVGVSYRRLLQSDKALAIYEQGLAKYPDNVIFAEGTIRCLADLKKYDEALAKANDDVRVHGQRPEILAAIKDIERMKPKPHKHTKKKISARHHRR